MENITWSFVVPLYPVNFTQVTRFLLQYAASFVNKFVPDLNGILIGYDKKSLNIITAIDSDISFNNYGLFPIHPELNYLRIRGTINARVFSPKAGLELDTTVSMVRPHIIICNTNISNITVSLSCFDLCSDSKNTNNLSAIISKFKLNDKVRIKLTHVAQNLGSFVIHGEPVQLLTKLSKSENPIVKIFEDFSSDEESSSTDKPIKYSNVIQAKVSCKPEMLSFNQNEMTKINSGTQRLLKHLSISSETIPNSDDGDNISKHQVNSEYIHESSEPPKKKRKSSKHFISSLIECKQECL